MRARGGAGTDHPSPHTPVSQNISPNNLFVLAHSIYKSPSTSYRWYATKDISNTCIEILRARLNMNAPNNKFPYNRRIPRHKRKRQPKSAALKNPYLEVAKPDSVIPADAGTKPKNPTDPSPRANHHHPPTTA